MFYLVRTKTSVCLRLLERWPPLPSPTRLCRASTTYLPACPPSRPRSSHATLPGSARFAERSTRPPPLVTQTRVERTADHRGHHDAARSRHGGQPAGARHHATPVRSHHCPLSSWLKCARSRRSSSRASVPTAMAGATLRVARSLCRRATWWPLCPRPQAGFSRSCARRSPRSLARRGEQRCGNARLRLARDARVPASAAVFALEVLAQGALVAALSTEGVHGDIFVSGIVGALSWAPDESKLLYAAESKQPPTTSFWEDEEARARAPLSAWDARPPSRGIPSRSPARPRARSRPPARRRPPRPPRAGCGRAPRDSVCPHGACARRAKSTSSASTRARK
jgi:hypothetical protein